MRLLNLSIFTSIFSNLFLGQQSFSLDQQIPQIQTTEFEGLEDVHVNGLSLLSFHKQLVEIDLTSNHEHTASLYLKQFLENAGLTVELQPIHDNYEIRYNVYAYYGKTRDTKVVVTSHFDTVPPYIPYSINGTKIFGRGTSDAKGSVASQTFAFLSLLENNEIKEGDVSLLFVVGEEVSGTGMLEANNLGAKWDIAIFGEPTELKLGVGHKGAVVFTLDVEGHASHSGYPQLGISAGEIIIPVLNKLINSEWPVDDKLGPSTLNIGRFEGGVAANVIPAHASAQALIRVSGQLDRVIELIEEAAADIDHLTLNIRSKAEPVYLDYEVPGFESIVLAYFTDVPNLKLPLKSRYLYGPGTILVAHGDDEYVENLDLVEAVDGYKRLVAHALSEL